jgi:hypothetical protein
MPSPKSTPIARLKNNRYRKSAKIRRVVPKVIPSFYSVTKLPTDLKMMMATASLIIPSPKSTEFRRGNCSCLVNQ